MCGDTVTDGGSGREHDTYDCAVSLRFQLSAATARASELETKSKADARALWAEAVLDKRQELNPDEHAFATCYLPELPFPPRKWKCVSFSHSGMFLGSTAREARLAAATSLYPDLPEAVRRELGECP